MKDIVNAKIKFREPYRPFAPSVLAECAEKYFELPQRDAALSGALHAVRSAGEGNRSKRCFRPSLTWTAPGRLQTVFKEQSPRYYSLIERFGQATGVPVVLNTSFNLRGEPIVTTPANAFNTF